MTRQTARAKIGLSKLVVAIGALAVMLAVGWWWIVFSELVTASTMSLGEALPCLARDSDLCSLAQSLCRQSHFLGIRRYLTASFWLASLLLGTGLLMHAPFRKAL